MSDGWVSLHEMDTTRCYFSPTTDMDDREWRVVTVRVGAIFCIAAPPRGWASGAVVHSFGPTLLEVRETRDEIIALCEGARKGRMWS